MSTASCDCVFSFHVQFRSLLAGLLPLLCPQLQVNAGFIARLLNGLGGLENALPR
jgi:hypothetical protein